MAHAAYGDQALSHVVQNSLHPPVEDRRFWAMLGMVLLTFLIHQSLDGRLGIPFIPAVPHQATLIIFAAPIIYATLAFGMTGAIATTAMVTVLTAIDVLQEINNAADLPSDVGTTVLEVCIFGVIAIVMGGRVESEKAARRMAEAARQRSARYAASVLRAQEEERRRIAQELHDQPVQSLVHLCRRLDRATEVAAAAPQAQAELQGVRETAQEIMADLRTIAKGLRPPALDDLGLVACVRRLVMDLAQRAGIEGKFAVDGLEIRLSPNTELALFRIAQEAISNVERHSAARHVDVQISYTPKSTTLSIVDDGQGFLGLPAGMAHDGLGILGMHERAELLGGTVSITSAPGSGTKVLVQVPRG